MRVAKFLYAALGGLSLSAAACAGPDFGRSGAAFPLSSGPPVNACERAEWYELAPAFVRARAVTNEVVANTYYAKVYDGVGVFRDQSSEPEDLAQLWPKMGEPDLARSHQGRIEPVDAARRRSLVFSLAGGVGILGGVGIYAATKDGSPTVAGASLGTGLVIGLLGAAGLLFSQPSGHDQLEANARRKLFIDHEDDEDAVKRGVANANGERRLQCGALATGAKAERLGTTR